MAFLKRLKPKFWDYNDSASGVYQHMFNFRQMWKKAVISTFSFAIAPLLIITFVNYRVTKNAMENEIVLRTSRLISNIERTVSFFLYERRFALDFIIHNNSFDELKNPERLNIILQNLMKSLSGISDLGVIDIHGRQIAYAGAYRFEGKDYKDQPWFKEVSEKSMYISDVFLGFRNQPHLVIAVKYQRAGEILVLRASVDINRIRELVSGLQVANLGNAFLIDNDGIIQTPTLNYASMFSKIDIDLPPLSNEKHGVYKVRDQKLLVGYSYISETPFILMVVNKMGELMKPFHMNNMNLIVFIIVSIVVILLVVLIVSTHLVSQIYDADHRRVSMLHKLEYANKMASIGRLSAGIAHEINNPLAIIESKAGLIQDIFTFQKRYKDDPKMLKLVQSIIDAVDRCSKITHRLLSFAKSSDSNLTEINIKNLIDDVLGFLDKEADYKEIEVTIKLDESMPLIRTDKGKLQQILLNLFNNAFEVLKEGGLLDITVNKLQDQKNIAIYIQDSGPGIQPENIDRIFEPFFTTKSKSGGTGLGLSITYGLVQELGGSIWVQSILGKGTIFTIILPLCSPSVRTSKS